MTESVAKMLPIIGIEMEGRGRDAWGASNGEDVVRHIGPLTESWYKSDDEFRSWKAGIFHTRGASHGSPKKLENAHPFTFEKTDGSKVIGIHNGIVSNHTELDSKYGRNFEVDSMHLWAHRAHGLPWIDIEGWGNLAWWETTKNEDDGKMYNDLHLLRFNNSSLELFRLQDGEFIFASTQAPIRVAAKMMGNPIERYWHLDEYTEYFLRPVDGKVHLWKGEKIPFVQPTICHGGRNYIRTNGGNCSVVYSGPTNRLPGVPVGPANTPGYVSGSATVASWGDCIKCAFARLDQSKALLCDCCLHSFIGDFELEMKENGLGINL